MRRTPYGRVSARHDRLFYTGGLRAAGGTRKKRRRAMSGFEHFVQCDDCPKNATSRVLNTRTSLYDARAYAQ